MAAKKGKGFGSLTKKVLQGSVETRPTSIADFQDDISYKEGVLYSLPIDLIHCDPNQPRQYFDPETLSELSASIKASGILQPLLVRIGEGDKIWLVAGERRYRAAGKAGLKQIPVIVTSGNPSEIALIENIQRENLKPIEEAEALDRMIKDYSYTHEQLAKVIGKARSTITETLSLNKLPDKIKDECRRADNFPRRLLVEIAKQDSSEKMLELFSTIKENDLTSTDVRKISRKKKKHEKPKSATLLMINRVNGLSRALAKLKIEDMDAEERIRFMHQLDELKRCIEQILK